MKNIKRVFILLILFSATNACNDLDLLPLDRVTTSSFYKTPADFDGALFASYSSIQDFWGTSTETLGEQGEYWKLSLGVTDDVAADRNLADGNSQDIDNLFIRASDVPYAALYTQIYEGLLRANLVLENLEEENELTAEQKTAFEAEARFLRAWFHFQAMKLWGTPPLVTRVLKNLNDLAQSNSSQDELFSQILEDFDVAGKNLPDSWDSGNTGRATRWAAKAYTGKVNVWKQDWNAAIAAFEDVIQNGPYALMDNYEDVFAYDMENNVESIFEVQFGGPFSDDNLWVFDDTHSEAFKASQGTGRGHYWDASNGAPGGKRGWWIPTQDLVDTYLEEPDDVRLDANVYMEGDMYFTTFTSLPYDPTWSMTGYTLKKYRGERNIVPANHSPNQQADFNNERWFRFAEMKLLYAEALIEAGRSGEALRQVNDIRNRAGLTDLDAAVDVTEAMRREKRLELAFEPHRWFDIVRWGIGSEVFGDAWSDNYVVFPFPQSEIDRSDGKLTQNPGY